MEVFIGYIPYIIVAFVLIGGAVSIFINEKKSVKEWLLLAVTEAEKALGGGVGALKLREVFKNFVVLYPTLAKFITFATFSKWVDKALVEMKKMLKDNIKVAEYVGVEKKNDTEDIKCEGTE